MSNYHYSRISKIRLAECDTRLQEIFNEVIKNWDCSIICGYRSEKDQTIAFKAGNSKIPYPRSKHNIFPSRAIDVAPYPINWNDLGKFYMFAGYVFRVAEEFGIELIYGGDWNGDKKTTDQIFNDLLHYEIK